MEKWWANFFLNIMEDILPIGPTEWDQVSDEHSVAFAGRDVNGLWRKYTTLYRKKIPTGELSMPDARRKYCSSDKAELGDTTSHYARKW